ncbi:MAG: hypothetical protein SF069_07180 [Phycisphaerae bacterium]|nr:hypothetical protein [Phycisphaerae bacterium]
MDAIENVADLSPTDRRREVAALLAQGVARWRKREKAAGFMPAADSLPAPENRLELSGESPLSVPTAGPRG